ncbi:MAG: phosphate ABC transporter permease PstA [Alcanivorax sp.]|nr:phosphate ABC transporter permease PstA [Alcanivorax sp.]
MSKKQGWFKSGTPWIWLNGGAVALSIVMVAGLLGLIAVRGLSHFWPAPIVQFDYTQRDGTQEVVMGEVVRSQTLAGTIVIDSGRPDLAEADDLVTRFLIKRGNRDVTSRDFMWYLQPAMGEMTRPRDAIVLERREWGNFYGLPKAVLEGDTVVAEGEGVMAELRSRMERALSIRNEINKIERGDIGDVNYRMEQIRLGSRRIELNDRLSDEEKAARVAELEAGRQALDDEYSVIQQRLDQLNAEASRDTLLALTADGREMRISLRDIVRVTQPNQLSLFGKIANYVDRFWEFMSGNPREANTEGGIFPAIFGTVTMVFIMSLVVTPFGVLAAIYLREYAKQGPLLRAIRISVYNLAGVPSIVYGVFGLGFFVYTVGGSIDQLFYPESLPAPTFGTPGLMWASLTLALLTLPVVIVSTEEGLSRIPSTIRQGSLALGATKAETLWRVVVPLATPAMMTGMILAIARAAGEVAPLMLVGVVKLAPTLPVDSYFPFIHLDRKIMHLGFHIYDVGFQSPNAEAARPLVYATALVLVGIIVVLNLTAISIRNRLREKYRADSD